MIGLCSNFDGSTGRLVYLGEANWRPASLLLVDHPVRYLSVYVFVFSHTCISVIGIEFKT